MNRKLLIVLLAAGTVLGFGSGIARVGYHLGCHRGAGWGSHAGWSGSPCWQAPPERPAAAAQ